MKVIFTQNVKKVGVKDTVKEVNDGYARNFLIPGKLAVEASPKALGELKKRLEEKDQKVTKLNKNLQEAVDKLKDFTLIIKKKANTEGHLFSSVTLKEIIEALHGKDIQLNESNFTLFSPVKKVGKVELPIKQAPDVMLQLDIQSE